MKRLMSLMMAVLAIMVLSTSCNKLDESSNPTAEQVDVQFNVTSIFENGGLKGTDSDTIICNTTLKADYAMYKIDGGVFKTIPIFYINDIMWTNAIKLPVGAHTLDEFIVYSDNNTAGIEDDVILSAVPHAQSVFAQYVTTPLSKQFNIQVDKKNEIKLDVVCFQPQYFTKFGFVYFRLNELVVRQLWFFGDFCIKDKAYYQSSLYSQQTNWASSPGPFIDVPAITKIEVFVNGSLQNTFSNSAQGEKLSITWGDYLSQTDVVNIKLYILVAQGSNFNYVLFKEWTFNDISNLSQGPDGVVDFYLGNCYDPTDLPDYMFAPWMNLPLKVDYKMTAFPSILEPTTAYCDALINNFSPASTSYDFSAGTWPSYCADHQTGITQGTTYRMDVYSSLYPAGMPIWANPTTGPNANKWEKINWLFNHLDWYPGYTTADIQGFIWSFDPTPGTMGPKSQQMRNDANAYGVNYKVVPGGWASIIFIKEGSTSSNPIIQTMIIKIDP